MGKLNLFSIYHYNLAFSAIEVEQRPNVLERCLEPLLNIPKENNFKIAIEAPAYTLEEIDRIRPDLMERLTYLVHEKKIEFVGSGYSQIISPIVPAKVAKQNLEIGKEIYQSYFGFNPGIYFVNEQVFSRGIIEHYLDIGARALIVDWNNAYSSGQLKPQQKYELVKTYSNDKREIKLIWNNSISFQKFQRYIHGEYSKENLTSYLKKQMPQIGERFFSFYGSDAEIFDYRPNRYQAEAKLSDAKEWKKIFSLYEELSQKENIEFVFPGEFLKARQNKKSKALELFTAKQPIMVKKQPKYNLSRWAITGRNDLEINRICYKVQHLLSHLLDKQKIDNQTHRDLSKKLCYFWSSDFRTHITEKRWKNFLKEIKDFEKLIDKKIGNKERFGSVKILTSEAKKLEVSFHDQRSDQKKWTKEDWSKFVTNEHILKIDLKNICIKLNLRRGMAIDGLFFKLLSKKALISTIPHGSYEEIEFSPDFYSNTLIFDRPMKAKVTDFADIKDNLVMERYGDQIKLSCKIETPCGIIKKVLFLFDNEEKIEAYYEIDFDDLSGSLRLGNLTLNPDAFDKESLFYETHTGGKQSEVFKLDKLESEIDHTKSVSSNVSASSGIANTEGLIIIGDKCSKLAFYCDKIMNPSFDMIHYKKLEKSFFLRLVYSLSELDETRKPDSVEAKRFRFLITPFDKL